MLAGNRRELEKFCDDTACVEVGVCFAVHEGQVREEPMGEGGRVYPLVGHYYATSIPW